LAFVSREEQRAREDLSIPNSLVGSKISFQPDFIDFSKTKIIYVFECDHFYKLAEASKMNSRIDLNFLS
jgi:hypothetical protein